MARTSKKNRERAGLIETREPSKVYSVGIYARLSVDKNERKNESIETQIEIAKAFINRQKDMVIYDCYVRWHYAERQNLCRETSRRRISYYSSGS